MTMPALADPGSPTRLFVLWRRTHPKGKWRPVGTYPTESAATAAINTHGDWVTLPAGRDPNDDAKPR